MFFCCRMWNCLTMLLLQELGKGKYMIAIQLIFFDYWWLSYSMGHSFMVREIVCWCNLSSISNWLVLISFPGKNNWATMTFLSASSYAYLFRQAYSIMIGTEWHYLSGISYLWKEKSLQSRIHPSFVLEPKASTSTSGFSQGSK